MSESGLDRRQFHQLALAALGGITAGAAVGCGGGGPATPDAGTPAATEVAANELTNAEHILLSEPHVCRGLNTCKGLGRSKDNACAGQGTCASIADASCATQNDCKGQGGCGALPGMNECKGQGGCHIPLMDDAWTKARETFEAGMKKQSKEFGAAPAKA
ncbi:hypothetical protein GC163_05760 [bacterium]|nr:hypothetical protein [bacterium]